MKSEKYEDIADVNAKAAIAFGIAVIALLLAILVFFK